jgi:hypothetical protein
MAEKDVDEQFAAIMAHWDDVAFGLDPSGDPHPDGPDDRGDDPTRAPEAVDEVTPAAPGADEPRLDDAKADDVVEDREDQDHHEDHEDLEAEWDDDDREDEHYTPPPPAPLPPSEDKHFWLMVIALVSGPLLFLYLLLFNRDGNGWWMLFALLVSIAGFVLLVLRQPLERDEGDDGIRL